MSYLHKNLAAGRWAALSYAEQMANIGSEVERTIRWKNKGQPAESRMAFERALELLDLTLAYNKNFPKLKEVARVREAMVDFFAGQNEYKSSEDSWIRYFLAFNYAARINR